MTFRPAAIALAALSLLAIASPALAAIPASERAALIAIYNKTGGASWANNSNWLGAPGTECSWFGVLCNQSPNFVAILNLPGNNLTGPLPAELAQLTNLQQLYLGGNKLTGSIPKELAALPLMNLSLSSNLLTGAIPPELGGIASLRTLHLDRNDLTGGIPPALAQLAQLRSLRVHTNANLGGTLPPELSALKNLQELSTYDCGIDGTIPPEYGRMTALRFLRLGGNNLTGALPSELRNLGNLEWLILRENRLSGTIPPWIAELTNLTALSLWGNLFTGPIPPELGNLTKLDALEIGQNALTGTFPPELGNLTAMRLFRVWDTDIGGPFPAFIESYAGLTFLVLDGNRLTGPLPSFLGNLTLLEELTLSGNALTGEIPSSFANLVNLDQGGLDLTYNGLTSSDPVLTQFLESKHDPAAPSFTTLQTVTPAGVAATGASPTAISVSWKPIPYAADPGGYRVEVAAPGGEFRLVLTTPDKSASSALVTGLAPSTSYAVRVSTVTYGAGGQKNTIVSAASPSVTASTQPSAPSVVLTAAPATLAVPADGATTATTGFTLTNVGQAPTTVTLAQSGSFFTQSPTSFTLAAGASQRVTITSLPQGAAASLRGSATAAGAGVPSSLVVPVALLVSAPPATGDPLVVVEVTRIDVAAPLGTNPSGSVKLRNVGTATATGLLSADAPWIVPDPSLLSIPAGGEAVATFAIDRARRPDAAAPSGTITATLSFVYLARAGSASRATFAGLPTLAAPVPVGDTVKPPVSSTGIPPLAPGEVGLVVPGVGNITGSVGVFVSDIAIGNALSGMSAPDLKLYFLAGASSLSASQPVASGQSLSLADVVSTVFGKSEQIGALHLRSALAGQLGVNASVFNKSNPAGTYGSAIPVFRTTRAIASGETSMVAGLRKSETSHTNVYLQEVSGTATPVSVTFLGADGKALGVPTENPVFAFAPAIIGQAAVPEGTVSMLVKNLGGGAVVAYATPVDRSSGDTWAITDWNRFFGRSGTEEQIIPVAGSAPGRNNTYFRTDVAIANPGTASAGGTLRYYQQTPAVALYEKPFTVAPRATLVLDDAVVSFFGAAAPSLGHVVVVPEGAAVDVSSRTYTTVQGTTKTFGTGVPALGRADALRLGQAKAFGAVKDSTASTTNAARPGTFRTNVGLVETDGAPVTVRVSVLLFDGRQLAAGGSTGEKSYTLAPHEFRQLNAIVSEILGAATRESSLGELDNVQVKVEVTGGEGAVLAYVSSTDNGSGDTVLRVE